MCWLAVVVRRIACGVSGEPSNDEMQRLTHDDLFRCDLCQREVDVETRERARRAWQLLIICERCVCEADMPRQGGGFGPLSRLADQPYARGERLG